MIAEGSFPFRQDDDEFEDAPRVGDGVILLDADLRVRFASPNAVSSMHRLGIHSYTSGLRLAEMGFDQDAVDVAIRARLPVTEEVERGETSLLVQAIPQLAGRPGRRRAACCCATSPTSAAVTACCSRRTPRSARSTTG